MPNHVHNVIFHIDDPKAIITGHNVDYRKVIPQPDPVVGIPNVWCGVISKYKERLTSELKFRLVIGEYPSSDLVKQRISEFKSLQDFMEWATITANELIEVGKLPKDYASMFHDELHDLKVKTAFEHIISCMYCMNLYGYENELDWNLANWSTKWNAYAHTHNDYKYSDKVYHTVGFRSAWSPPFSVYFALAKKTNFLTFTTDEVLGEECYIFLGLQGECYKWCVSGTDIGNIVATAICHTHEDFEEVSDFHVQHLMYDSVKDITTLDKIFVRQEAKKKFRVILDEFERVLTMEQSYNSAKESILSKHLIIGG